jgi:hypothetical protein
VIAAVAGAITAAALATRGSHPPVAANLRQAGSAAGGRAGADGGAGVARSGAGSGTSGSGATRLGASGSAPALVFCQTTPGPALRTAVSRLVPGSSEAEVQPLGVSGDGRQAYASTWSAGFSGVAALSLSTGKLQPIKVFAHPASDQADGSSAGQWLVWAQTYSLASLDHFTMYAWNAATRHLSRLGGSIAGPNGVAWPSPWHAPAVGGGHYAAWAQGYGPGGLVEIRLANLDTGQVATIRTGHTQPPFFDGGLVVWPESDAPGTQTTLRAYSLAARQIVPLPAALRSVHGTEFVVTDGTRTAYLSPGLTQLYYSPRQDEPARLALSLPAGADFADLAMAPDTLAWTTSRATYLASTRTGAFAKVTPQYGYATGSASVVLVTDAPSQKEVHPALPLHVIDPAAIRWPACHAAATSTR